MRGPADAQRAGLVKTYDIACLEEVNILCNNTDRRQLPVRVVLRPKEFSKVLTNFHSGQVDVTFASLPDVPAAGAVPVGGVKRLRLLSFVDPSKATPTGTHLTTRLALDASDEMIMSYTHRGNVIAEATVNLKDLKARASFLPLLLACSGRRV